MSSVSRQTSDSDDDWMNEDPNLLNNPELLYAACAKLPPPETDPKEVKDYWDSAKVVRELILDQNFLLESLSKRDELRGSVDSAKTILDSLLAQFEADCMGTHNALAETFKKPTWSAEGKNLIFSNRSAETVQRWKKTLNLFLENYLKIRSCIPAELLEGTEDDVQAEKEKEQCRLIPVIVQELENFLDKFDTFMKCE